MRLNDLTESRKMLKQFKDKDVRPPRSYSDFSKSPRQLQLDTTQLYSWGLNTCGQLLKNNKNITPHYQGVTLCSAGENHTIIVNNKNEVIGFGDNQFGQLGYESNTQPKLTPIFKDQRITSIVCGAEHTFMLTAKGEVYSWGLNLKGQLGLGCFDNINQPTLVYGLLPFGNSNGKAREQQQGHKRMKSANEGDQSTSPGLKERSSSIDNVMEQLVMMKEKIKQKNPNDNQCQILLQNDEAVQQVACGALHTLILTNKNRIFSCGFGESYALGHQENQTISEFKLIQNLSHFKVEKISCGLAHSGCIIEGGKPYLWGYCKSNKDFYKQPTQIKMVDEFNNQQCVLDMKMGEMFTLFLTSKGEVYSMGDNIQGQLGNDLSGSDVPIKISGLPLISQISAGRNHSLALSADYKYVYGWGSNIYGQLTGQPSVNGKGIISPKLLFTVPETQRIVCGNFHSILLSPSYLEIILDENDNNNKEQDKLNEEVEKYRNEQEILKQQNIQLQQKYDRMKNELISKKKVKDQKVQTTESYIQRQIKKQQSKFDISALEISPERPIKHRIFQSSLDIDFNDIMLEKQISEGGYGVIYRAKWRETIVAVKMFKIDGMNENHIRDFLSECHAMEALRHPNIVMFLGACTKPPNLAIVLEYCQRGSLWQVIQNHDIHLTWEDRRKMALDAAKGVLYLHSFNPPILHRDLKSLNLLLDEAFRTKLADFGWTRTLSNYMTSKIGTYQWMAPEVIAGQVYTEKADVFSFGIILWEIAAREPPYRNITGLQVSLDVLNNDFRPTIPKKTPEVFTRLTKRCWDRDPEKRPSFKEIIKELEMMKFPQGV
ncbi:unnamed protein product [Paramecium pentaurelia]|uniref:non-specific serine/threonine protein kinase n=1 Tax=Paramecium pentaurelia TaxID=43138 RepID=A0A8S1Y9U3_9CILI|nr:unnamed protein product [Paramecium pentaurelia]